MGRPEPKQKRSRETRDRIVGTAEKLFAERGYNVVNTNLIAVEAGVSVGSFYNYFDDKKDVLLAVLVSMGEYVKEEMENTVSKVESDAAEEEVVLELVKMAIRIHKHKSGLIKAVIEIGYLDPEIYEYVRRNQRRFTDLLVSALSNFERERGVKIRNKETKAKILVTAVESVCHENIFFDLGIEEEMVIQELKDLIIGYLATGLDLELTTG